MDRICEDNKCNLVAISQRWSLILYQSFSSELFVFILYKTEPLMPLLQYSEWSLLNIMSYHDSDSCPWNILNFSCLFFAASLIHNQEPCIFKWFLICEESVLSLPVFFYVDIASLFKNQGKWHKSLWEHWKELDKEASLTRGGVVLGTVSTWLLSLVH